MQNTKVLRAIALVLIALSLIIIVSTSLNSAKVIAICTLLLSSYNLCLIRKE